MKKYLADRTSLIDASGIRKVFALAESLDDPINFSIGQPGFNVPDGIKAAAIEAIHADKNNYSQTAGERDLVEKIGEAVRGEYGWDEAHVLVTCGVSGGILLSFMSLIDPGDEVVIVDPYFVIYKHAVRMVGGRCVFVDSYPDFALPVERIAEAITPKTKMLLLNSPANPTGAVYSEEAVRAVAGIAAEHDLVVISDEIYSKFCYDGPCVSIARYYDKTLVLNGFGKTYGMTGWRMGYAAAGGVLGDLIDEMTKLQQYTFVCAPTPFQSAAVAAMDHDMSEYFAAYKKKRDMIYEGLADKFELARPAGAYYAFVKAPAWAGSATEFVERVIENNVLVIPGNVFSEKDTHFRISYAATDEKIAEGIEILRGLAAG